MFEFLKFKPQNFSGRSWIYEDSMLYLRLDSGTNYFLYEGMGKSVDLFEMIDILQQYGNVELIEEIKEFYAEELI